MCNGADKRKPLIANAGQMIVISAYPSKVDLEFFGPAESVKSCESWAETLAYLISTYPKSAKVSVYPYAAIQMPAN